MEFYILSVLSVLAFIYCCDMPVINGFEWLVNNKSSLQYNIGVAIIASYIFYIVQVWMPQKVKEHNAYSQLKKKILDYIDVLYEIVGYVDTLCDVDEKNGKIDSKTPYFIIERSDWKSKYLEKFDVDNYYEIVIKQREKITNSGYFFQLSNKKINCLQKILDNDFITTFYEYSKTKINVNFCNLISDYEALKKGIISARKVFKVDYNMSLKVCNEQKQIEKYEKAILLSKDIAMKRKSIPRMRLGANNE